MMSLEKLMIKLPEAKLKPVSIETFRSLMIDINDPSWKRKKMDSVVFECYVERYELWNKHLVKRVFYVVQKWLNKEKIEYFHEVQRYLAGSKEKWNRGVYNASFAGMRPIKYVSCEQCPWFKSDLKRYTKFAGSYMYEYTPFYTLNGFRPLLEKSVHQYCAFDYTGLPDDELFDYLYRYESHPQFEMISKMGLYWLSVGNMNSMHWKEKGLRIFGIQNKKEIERIKVCVVPGTTALKFYKKHKQDIYHYNLDSTDKILAYNALKANKIELSIKLFDYLTDNSIRYFDYIDYYSACKKLGVVMNSNTKYPNDFKKTHDDTLNKIKIIESKKVDQKIIDFVNEKLFKYRFADENYVITPAHSVGDLINESNILNHCVRTYGSRYARCETSIFLIRKRDDVMTPYYTLELKKNDIVQVRGKHNCDATPEINEFLKKWCSFAKIKTQYFGAEVGAYL